MRVLCGKLSFDRGVARRFFVVAAQKVANGEMTKLICTSALKDVDVMAARAFVRSGEEVVARRPARSRRVPLPRWDPHILIALVELSEIRPELET